MSDQEKGPGTVRGPGENPFDAVERLRRKSAETGPRETEGGASNVVRLPRRPRRRQDDAGGARRQPPIPDGGYDPAATRPVTRAELQRETETMAIEEAARARTATNADRDANLVDLDARRKRTGARRMVRPRRIGATDSTRGDHSDPDSPRPDEPRS